VSNDLFGGAFGSLIRRIGRSGLKSMPYWTKYAPFLARFCTQRRKALRLAWNVILKREDAEGSRDEASA
jgi:hypothetical protein